MFVYLKIQKDEYLKKNNHYFYKIYWKNTSPPNQKIRWQSQWMDQNIQYDLLLKS